jgi:8-oxo-dGTP diphosphatase
MRVVVAGLLRRDGLVLITQRKTGSSHALKWEFPGGKVEPGETPRQALRRELREELDIGAEIGGEVERYSFGYPGKRPIQLIFFWIDRWQGEPVNRVFENIQWVRPPELASYDFLEGDRDFVLRVAAGERDGTQCQSRSSPSA